jgi:catechol 2,3-dioxygenase-like lactoylglutathione lyase family enzyme
MPDERPRLDQVNLVSRDVAASVAFYELLGVEMAETQPGWEAWDPHHQTVALEGSTGISMDIDSASFAAWWAAEGLPTGPVLGFRVASRESVDATYERLTGAGHRGVRAPYDAFWGARYALVEDPDGVVVGVMSEASAEFRRAGPDLEEFAPEE